MNSGTPAELGFAADERVARMWSGLMYVGPLRPDADHSALGSFAAPRGMRGVTCVVALSDRGRLSVSGVGSPNAGLLFGPEAHPNVQTAQQAFATFSGLGDELRTAPELFSADGQLVRYELVHLVGPESPKGVTFWLAPEAAEQLRTWAAARRLPQHGPAN